MACVVLVATDVSVEVAVAAGAAAGCGWRTGEVMPEGPDTTVGCAGAAAGAAVAATGAADGAGELSAGCISTTQPDAATNVPMQKYVLIGWLFTICLIIKICRSQHIAKFKETSVGYSSIHQNLSRAAGLFLPISCYNLTRFGMR